MSALPCLMWSLRAMGSAKLSPIVAARSCPLQQVVAMGGSGAMKGTGKSEQELALILRAKWMRATGVSEEEIAEYSDPVLHPIDLAEELENVQALENRAAMSRSELERLTQILPKWIDD